MKARSVAPVDYERLPRRYYRLTRDGQAALDVIRTALAELQGEIMPTRKKPARKAAR